MRKKNWGRNKFGISHFYFYFVLALFCLQREFFQCCFILSEFHASGVFRQIQNCRIREKSRRPLAFDGFGVIFIMRRLKIEVWKQANPIPNSAHFFNPVWFSSSRCSDPRTLQLLLSFYFSKWDYGMEISSRPRLCINKKNCTKTFTKILNSMFADQNLPPK